MAEEPFILVVDDHQDVAGLLVDLLRQAGYQAKALYSGAETLKLLKPGQEQLLPEIILLDLMMPGVDGFEVLRQLKNDPEMPYIPVIIITASGESQNRILGLKAGADDYLTKPVHRAELVARVKSLLRLKQAHDEQGRLVIQIKTAFDQLYEAQVSLAKAEKKKGQMEAMVTTASAISHEISQPLTGALITLQLVKQSVKEGINVTQDLEALETSLLQARSILDKLRALSRYETKTYLGNEHILDIDLSSSLEVTKDGSKPGRRVPSRGEEEDLIG